MGAISTTAFSEPIGYPNQQYIERENFDGNLWFLKRVSQTQIELFRSNDNGASWATTGVTYTRTGLQEISGFFMDSNGHGHVLLRVYESGTDRVFYLRWIADAAAFSTEQFVVGASTGAAGNVYTGLDLVAFKLNTTWYIHMAVGTHNGTVGGITLFSATVSSANVFTMRNTLISGTRQWLNGPDGIVHPTLTFEHTGDGKNSIGSPSLWVAWGRSTIYTARYTWAAGPLWAAPVGTPPVVASLSPSQPSNSATYDAHGDRFLVPFPTAAVVRIGERNVDNTSGTSRDTPTHPQGVVKHCAISVSSATSNMRVYAVGTSNNTLYFVDYDRTNDTWSSWSQVSASAIVGATFTNYSVRRVNYGNGHYDSVITTGSGPYNLISTSNTAASAPKTPAITAPPNGVAQDVNQALALTWTFVDDDPSDFQDSYALRRVIGASTTYWNASTSTWDAVEVFNSSGTLGLTLASGWGADSDATHNYSIKVKDQQGNSSPNSPNIKVTPSAKDNPTITSPTASPTAAQITVAWTVATQTAYRIVLTKSGVVIRDTGWETSAATSVLLPDTLLAQAYVVNVTTRNDEGLTSDTATLSFTPAYTAPATGTLGVAGFNTLGVVRNTIVNPDPVQPQPIVTLNEVYRRVVGDTGTGVKVGTTTSTTPLNWLTPFNPGFESTVSSVNWGAANAAVSTAARDTTQFRNGVASFAQTAVNATGFAGINFGPLNQFPVTPTQVVSLTFWFKTSVVGYQIRGVVGWRTAGNTSNGSSNGSFVAGTGAWQQYTMTATAPASTAYGFPSLAVGTTANTAGDKVYVDDVTFGLNGAVAIANTYDDFTAASDTPYEYSVVTTGVNGAITQSGWVS